MKKSIFQRLYTWISTWNFPPWLHELLDKVLHQVVIPTLQVLGEEAVLFLRKKIVEASRHEEWDGTTKFKYVFDMFKEEYGERDIKNRVINLGIEMIVNKLKAEGMIR